MVGGRAAKAEAVRSDWIGEPSAGCTNIRLVLELWSVLLFNLWTLLRGALCG